MNIGDRVRLLHGNEEGVITKISPGGRVEVEIEDGFRIPAMKNEVVVISAIEKQYFGGDKIQDKDSMKSVSPLGKTGDNKAVFIAYIPLNDKDHSIYLCNNSERDYLVMVSEVYGENSQTIFADKLNAKNAKKIGEKSIQNFEDWPVMLIQLLRMFFKVIVGT
jgi:hypothetical protein